MILEKTRKLSAEDISRAVEMILDGIRQYISLPFLKHAKTKSVSNHLNNFIIYREAGSIQGFLMYRIDKECTILYEVHVASELRSSGVGTRLMQELFIDRAGKLVILFVHKGNLRAQKFYQSFGFEFQPDYNEKNYYQMLKQN